MTQDLSREHEDANLHHGAQVSEGAVSPVAKRTAAARVLSLLGAFSRGDGALTLSEISRYAKLSLTTTHRLAKEVLEWGGLELDEEGRYRLSRKILDLASASTNELHLRETALPHVVDLHRRTGLTVHLSVRDGVDVVYLEALRRHANYSGENRIGGRLRLHVTATGLVLLGYADEDVVRKYCAEPLKQYTEHTITTAADLQSYLRTVRQRGYAISDRAISEEVGAVGAPVMSADGAVESAVGVVYFVEHQDPRFLVDMVRLTAKRISKSLRERDAPPDPRTIDFNRRHAGLI